MKRDMRETLRFKLAVAMAALIAVAVAASISGAEIIQKGIIRVNFDGDVKPHVLPRHKEAPVTVSVSTRISTTDNSVEPPELLRISLAINRNGHIDYKGLPQCHVADIQPSNNA